MYEQGRQDEQEIHLSDYFLVLLKHRMLIITTLLLTVGVTVLFTLRMAPVYQASATLVIDSEKNRSPLTGERTDYESYFTQELTFNTHFKLITSRPVLAQVIHDLKLDRDAGAGLEPGMVEQFLGQVKHNVNLLLQRQGRELTPEEKYDRHLARLLGKITIKEVAETRLLEVVVEDTDPVLARDIANSVGSAYIRFNIDNQLRSTRNSFNWLSDQSYEVKKRLEDAEREFLDFKEKSRLFSVESRQQVISQKISEFNDAYVTTRNSRQELEAKLAELQKVLAVPGADILQSRSLIKNPMIESLYSQLVESEIELSRLREVFRDKHPKIVQANTRFEETSRKLREVIAKELANMKSEVAVLSAREEVQKNNIDEFQNEALEINKNELQYSILQRNVTTNQSLYDTLLAKLKETDITENFDVSNIRIAEDAVLPVAPVKPRKKLNVLLGLILGLMGGIGLAFFLEYMDRSLRTEEDVQRYLGLPVLSVVPLASQDESRQPSARCGPVPAADQPMQSPVQP